MTTGTHIKPLALAALLLALAASASACASQAAPEEKVIVVPSTATAAPPYRGDGSPPPRRYVVRMSDGERDWEVEFPETASGYELRIPLEREGRDLEVEGDDLTAADREMLESLRRRNVGVEREGVYVDGKNKADPEGRNQVGGGTPGAELDGGADADGGIDPWAGTEDQPAPTRRSYFMGIENVKKLYRAGRYEMAIIYLKELAQDYPDDPKIMSMMGTLYLKLDQEDLAREYWERVLQIEPDNRTVIEALKQLNQRRSRPTPRPAQPADGAPPPP